MIRSYQRFFAFLYVIFDFLIIQASFGIAWFIKFESDWLESLTTLPMSVYAQWSIIYGLIAITLGALFSIYSAKRKKRFADEALKILQIHGISFVILLSLMFFFKQINISRDYLAIYLTCTVILISFYRYTLKLLLKELRKKGFNKQFVLILGAGSLGQHFYNSLKQNPELGYAVVGFLDDIRVWNDMEEAKYPPILGDIDLLEIILNKELIDEVVLALPLDAHERYSTIIATCEKSGVRTLIIPDFFDYLPARPYFDNFAGIPMINVRDVPLDLIGNRILKRVFDIIFSLIAIIITSPILIIIAILIKLSSKGPVLFKQERVGLNKRNFNMYKFRSMRVTTSNKDDNGWTVENDPRRTKFGAFLRKTSLDELPQFFNVLAGHMSVVGPRPERPFYVEQFREEVPKYMVKHHVRPGITGWAQTNGLRGDTSIDNRIKHDIFYIENWSFLFDIKIILKTIVNGFINRNAY